MVKERERQMCFVDLSVPFWGLCKGKGLAVVFSGTRRREVKRYCDESD